MDRLSDQDLISICNDGDAGEAEAAFNALYRRHKDYVVRIALRFVNDHDTALDVLQETFSYLLRKFPPSGPGVTLTARMTTFLYPVARNLAISQRRKDDRRAPVEGLDPDDLPAAPAAPAESIGRLLQRLSEERREVVLLRFVDDLSLKEIAEALDIPVGTVKSRLHLAIRQLRESTN